MMDKLLRIDLTIGKITTEDIPAEYLRDYLGGAGLAARYLYDEIPVCDDVFDGSNKLMFSVGPLNGGYFPTSGRYNVSCRSPLTGIWLDSSSSGKFGFFMRKAGYMGIIIEGKSATPVYIAIDNDTVEIKDASKIWGLTVTKTIEAVQEDCGMKKASVAAIGPSGEKLIKIACILNDSARAIGRGGAGALMGSKNLKAILVAGDNKVPKFEEDSWKELVKDTIVNIKNAPVTATLGKYGTGIGMAAAPGSGDAPTKNFALGTWDKYNQIDGPYMTNTILKDHAPECHACPIHCARYVEISDGPYEMKGSGPEYEALGALGSNALNDDLESIAYFNMLCNEQGVDVISAGAGITFAMEAYEKGILTKEELGGIDLKWGDQDAMQALLTLIMNKEGIGALLGEGTKHAATVIGKGSEDFAVHVKGMELPMHDPRAYSGFAVTYATSPRGGCHCHGYNGGWDGSRDMPEAGVVGVMPPHQEEGKSLLVKAVQDFCSAVNGSIICYFTLYTISPTQLATILTEATGYDYDAKELLKTGERIFNLQRAFNNKFGITRKDDSLPKRVMTSVIGGPNEGIVPNLDKMLAEYYLAREWNEEGKPSKEKLTELGLDFVIKDLYQ
ncbi:MAG: aldehyde ferredoxin oxidoreductase family protein [Eubacteriaceae bacterium]|nr:aldehyde ferredoxin oxidoreductase family protein [Eubacteriaceae bacterium]